jgi:hypothetical protein
MRKLVWRELRGIYLVNLEQTLSNLRIDIHAELAATVTPGAEALFEQENAGGFASPIGGQRELRGHTALANASWPHQ